MTAEERRADILLRLQSAAAPLSATALSEQYGVSRQVIVGDIALLRAAGAKIHATPRGYTLPHSEQGGLLRTIACVHDEAQTEQELCILVDNGCTVRDVIVEHPVYGQLTGVLELRSRYDVSRFLELSAKAAPLCSLTDGVHLHTLICPDEAALLRVRQQLDAAGILLPDAGDGNE
ncbi:MAG: transcription repressor NadR [Oscillospiraceae bacterium]|nr:transcription repressor NadR [Oscillospiraceae bacterium]